MHDSKQSSGLMAAGKSTSVVIISFIYAAINELSSNITLGDNPDASLNFGIFVPASAAILFGKGVGGAAAGLGAILTDVQEVLAGREDGIDRSTLLTSIANFLGAYITGFLTQKEFQEESTQSMRSFLKKGTQWRRIGHDTIGAIVGMSLTTSFISAYSDQINTAIDEGENLGNFTEGSATFLSTFFASAAVLVVSIPLTLFAFDLLAIWLSNRGVRIDAAARDISWEVPDPGDAQIESVFLPEHAFAKNIWTEVKLIFNNKTGRETAFDIEGVSTSRMYPHLDTSPVIQPGEVWEQTFFVLPVTTDDVKMRFRVTPKKDKQFKGEILDDAIVEASGVVIDPSKNRIGIAQFGGVNFSFLGLSIVWQDFVDTIQDPGSLIDSFGGDAKVVGITAIIEAVILMPLLLILYRIQRNRGKLDDFSLAFSEDLESHGYQERAKTGFIAVFLKYNRIFSRLLKVVIGLATVGTIGFLGYEGYQTFNDPNYQTEDPSLVFISAGAVLLIWIFAIRGLDILNGIGKNRLPPWVLRPGNVILDFKPTKQFQVGIPNEVIVTVQNPTDRKGLRIVFEGIDTVSPPMVELHLEPNEVVNFKIAVTSIEKENRDILAIAYPFFDEEGNYLSFDESEPFARQDISYEVQGQTKLGITKSQQSSLIKLGGLGTLIASALTFFDQLFPEAVDYTSLIKESGPYLAALQAPFIYAYFYYRNKLQMGSARL